MRVLHLTAGNLFGGIETYLITLARCRHLVPAMEPHFGLCFAGRLRDELVCEGVSTYDLGPVRLSRPWTTWNARRRLSALLREVRFDVVVTHGSWPHIVFAPSVRRTGLRLVHAVHDNLCRPTWLDGQAARTPPDLVIANSRFTATAAAKLFIKAAVEVVHLPVAAPDIADHSSTRREVRSAIGTSPDAVVILQVSRLEECKGHAIHLDALSRLKDVPSWEAWFVGGAQKTSESGFLAELKRLAGQVGVLDRVRFLGQRSDVSRLMAAADVYCQPNRGPESFGITYIEALYAGLPVVTSGFGGAAEIVDETCGVLTPPGDALAVAAALRDLIQHPNRRAELAGSARQRATELCEPEQQLHKCVKLLSQPYCPAETQRRGHEAVA